MNISNSTLIPSLFYAFATERDDRFTRIFFIIYKKSNPGKLIQEDEPLDLFNNIYSPLVFKVDGL